VIQKENRLLRIGVLGCGPISQFAHFDAARKARNCELYAMCDLADDLLQRMAAIHAPKKTFTKLDDMLADTEVEAVIVATSDQFHVPLCLRAIDAGKHVFVEKPLGVSIEECDSLSLRVHDSRRILQVGNNRRFDPGVMFARRFIEDELGPMIALKAWYCDSTARYTMTDNLQPIPITSKSARKPEGDPKADKRRYFMLTHGSHLVDTARFLGGEITAVDARIVERANSYCWYVSVDFASGAMGHLDLTVPLRGDFQEGFQICGEGGSIRGNIPLPWYFKSGEVECFSEKTREFRRVLGEDAFSYKLQLEHFADAILHGAPMRAATAADGLAAMRAMVAIARSVELGRKVPLSEAVGSV
jgi:predicted dehydrogenase